jgi:hypothetical protein
MTAPTLSMYKTTSVSPTHFHANCSLSLELLCRVYRLRLRPRKCAVGGDARRPHAVRPKRCDMILAPTSVRRVQFGSKALR